MGEGSGVEGKGKEEGTAWISHGIRFEGTYRHVVAGYNPRSPMNVVNVQTQLPDEDLESFLYSFEHGSVTLCGRMCSLQPTRVHNENADPTSDSHALQLLRTPVTPPYQLNSITLILQGGTSHWRVATMDHFGRTNSLSEWRDNQSIRATCLRASWKISNVEPHNRWPPTI